MGLLRFLLAIAVVIAHSTSIFGFSLVGGVVAVQSFYIISGFYMALILNEKYIGQNNSYKLFITNRFLRLYPIYWSVLILTILFSIYTFFYSNSTNWGRLSFFIKYFKDLNFSSFIFLILTNLFLFFQDIVMFLGLDITTGHLFFTANFMETNPRLHRFLIVPQAWTIGVEMLFYLIAPFLVRRKVIIIFIIAFLSFTLRLILYKQGLNHDPWTYRFFPTELLFFLLGILAYKLSNKKNLSLGKYSKTIWFTILFITLFYNFISIPFKYPIYIAAIFFTTPLIFSLTKKWKYDRYLGELSYPIYISHIFMMSIIDTLNVPILISKGFTLTIFTVIISIILHELVAKKIEKFRQNRVK